MFKFLFEIHIGPAALAFVLRCATQLASATLRFACHDCFAVIICCYKNLNIY